MRDLDERLRPRTTPAAGLSPWEVTRCLRDACPRDTIATTDVGSVKFIVSQAWTTYEPMTFLESNGLSAMGYGLPAAIAAKLRLHRPVLCTVGDGGLGMRLADLETCVRLRLPLVIVVFNDDGLSLIRVVQQKRGYADYGVGYRHAGTSPRLPRRSGPGAGRSGRWTNWPWRWRTACAPTGRRSSTSLLTRPGTWLTRKK